MTITESIFDYYNHAIANEIAMVVKSNETKEFKNMAIQAINYTFNKLIPLIKRDLGIIESAYNNGINNPNDGVFKVLINRSITITLSKEVAIKMHKNPNVQIEKLTEKGIIEFLLKKIEIGLPIKFIDNIEALNVFNNRKRKIEIIKEFSKHIPQDYLNHENIEWDGNWGDAFLFKDKRYKRNLEINEVNEYNHQKVFKDLCSYGSMQSSTIKKTIGLLGYKRASDICNLHPRDLTEGLLFSINPTRTSTLMFEVCANSEKIYTKENAAVITDLLKYSLPSYDLVGNEILEKIKTNVLNNITELGAEATDKIIKIFIRNNKQSVIYMFQKSIENMNIKDIEKIKLNSGGIVTGWIKRNFFPYDKNNIPCIITKNTTNQQVIFDINELENDVGFSEIYQFKHIIAMTALKLGQFKKISADNKNKNSMNKNSYMLTIPNKISFNDILDFAEEKTLLAYNGHFDYHTITSNLFHEYLLNKKLKEIDNKKSDVKNKVKRKI